MGYRRRINLTHPPLLKNKRKKFRKFMKRRLYSAPRPFDHMAIIIIQPTEICIPAGATFRGHIHKWVQDATGEKQRCAFSAFMICLLMTASRVCTLPDDFVAQTSPGKFLIADLGMSDLGCLANEAFPSRCLRNGIKNLYVKS
jgi:hypothetical protein